MTAWVRAAAAAAVLVLAGCEARKVGPAPGGDSPGAGKSDNRPGPGAGDRTSPGTPK